MTRFESWLRVTSARRLYLLHLGLGSVGAAAVLGATIVALTRIEPDLPPANAMLAACRGILPTEPGLGLLVLALGILGLAVITLAARSLSRQLRRQRRFLRRWARLNAIEVNGRELVLVRSTTPEAFCAGFLRPRIYLSTAALERLTDAELRAVIAHETHHQRSHDPLRVLLATVAAEALFFLPALRVLNERYRELAELAADEAASKAEGAPVLASALLTFGERDGQTAPVVGIAAERVDHLLGNPPRWRLPLSTFTGSLIILSSLLIVIVTAGDQVATDSFSLVPLVAEVCMIAMFALPPVIGVRLLFRWRGQRPRLYGQV
ncbi:MAG: M56 family metallopeptidase [Solirubrobacterales bacterium]|nr:M56 family metallopeptidase [Solirubrobacterales bacterium]